MDMTLELLENANAAGIRLEIVRGVPMWEAQPVLRHQRSVDRIRRSLVAPKLAPLGDDTPCGCSKVVDA